MNVLVTGGAGYIGSTLVPRLLSAGHKVRVLDLLLHGPDPLVGLWSCPTFEFIRGDVRDAGTVKTALEGMDAVIHLAAIVGDPACAANPQMAREVNLQASLSLFKESKESGVSRFLFASTCSNYGKMPDPELFVDETSELSPVSLYAETKVEVEKQILLPEEGAGIAPTVLRFSTVYGVSPRMRFDLTVNEFTMEMIVNKKLVVFGEQFWRPYIGVMDAARVLELTLKAPPDTVQGEVFNAGSTDQNYKKQDLVEMIDRYVPGSTIEYVHREEDPRDYRVDFGKLRDALGYEKTYTVEKGILEVARLVRSGMIADFGDSRYRNS